MMNWMHFASGMLAISQLLYTGLYYLAYHRRHRMASYVALFCLTLISYIVLRLPIETSAFVAFTLNVASALVPAFLWLLSRSLFEDESQIHVAVWLLMPTYVGLRAYGAWQYDGGGITYEPFFLAFFYLPQLIMLGFVLHVILVACVGLAGDLVEPRRRLRVPFAIGMGTVVAGILGSGFLQLGSDRLDTWYFMAIFLLMLFVNLALARIQQRAPQLVTGGATARNLRIHAEASGEESAADRQTIERIRQAMEEERLYTVGGLTIGQMAEHLGLQEYRLRRLINQTLHYRNFNQYLNSYRIADAAQRLRDPVHARLSIYNIALDVGYASLSSFNKAFKENFGMTPSAYRSSDSDTAPQALGQPRAGD